MRQFFISTLIIFLVATSTIAQYSRKVTSAKFEAYQDSIRNVDYKYVFPILGKGAYSRGFDIPFPAGIMLNFFTQTQDVTISGLEVGLEGAINVDPVNLDSIVVFDNAIVETQAFNIRPDLWIFPFLNVYGIFAKGTNNTIINFSALGVEFPEIQTNFDATGTGFGVMFAGGLGPGWISIDNNWSWTAVPALEEKVKVHNLGIRFGATYTNKRKPYRNLGVWVGAFRQRIDQNTAGSLSFGEVFDSPDENLAQRLEDRLADWEAENCSSPIPSGKCLVLPPLVNGIIDNLRENEPVSNTDLTYSLQKEVVDEWNIIIGGQYQLNKRWQLRSEYGFLGSRNQFLASIGYRFLL
jgi:hypothetical protein